MKLSYKLTASTAILAALGACSSNSGGGGSITPPPAATTRLYSDTDGTPGNALNADKTLTSQPGRTSGVRINYGTGDVITGSDEVKIVKNNQGGLTMTVNGVERVFTAADKFTNATTGFDEGFEINNPATNTYHSLWSWSLNDVDDAIDPNQGDYAQVWEYWNYDPTTDVDTTGFAVVGTETRPSALALLPTATYNGRMQAKLRPTTGYVNSTTSQSRIRADMTMTANFGSGTVDGNLSNITLRAPGTTVNVPTAGSITMNTAPISGNDFAGSLTADATYSGNASNPTIGAGSNYSGSFFGPAAEQVAGQVSLQGSNGGNPYIGSGYFTGN